MFTGIIEHAGCVVASRELEGRRRLSVDLGPLAAEVQPGASIAVNGVCLTAVARDGANAAFDVIPETLACSNLGALVAGARVNLERALVAGARLDGHFVQGHVDATGTIVAIDTLGGETRMTVATSPELLRLCIPKGSVALDGVSLTIAALGDQHFTVALIPHTLEITTLGERRVGDALNLEADMLGKYVQRLLEAYRSADA